MADLQGWCTWYLGAFPTLMRYAVLGWGLHRGLEGAVGIGRLWWEGRKERRA